jgi:transcription initiation factor TFIIH subunit 2
MSNIVEEDEEKKYAWEKKYETSWSKLIDEELSDKNGKEISEQRRKRQRLVDRVTSIVERGVIRFMFLVIDWSSGILLRDDMKIRRYTLMESTVKEFIKDYFDQNPLCQLGLIFLRNGIATKLCDPSSNPKSLLLAFGDLPKMGGDASLQNGLDMAINSFVNVPPYGSREILILYSSLGTSDPGDIFESIDNCKKSKIRCSVVGLGSEIYICKVIAKETSGTYGIPLNEEHFRELVFDHSIPPPSTTTFRVDPSLIEMGFPARRSENVFSICVCHKKIQNSGYVCPKCGGVYCEIPVECQICSLSLVSSPHLARSYHHLFPVKPFEEIESKKNETCTGCQKEIITGSNLFLKCLECDNIFCVECDSFIHDSLHNCPTCESNPSK